MPATSSSEAAPDTEERILEAARRVFLRVGTQGARMQEIADEAGVNKALLHYYFRSKERLAEAVFLRVAGRFFPRFFEYLASDTPLEEKVRGVVARELTFLVENPYLPGYILGELHTGPERLLGHVLTMIRPPLGALQAQLDAAAAAGRIRPIDVSEFVINLISLCVFPFAAAPMLQAVFRFDADGFAAFIEERKRSLPEFFLNALRPTADPAS